MPVSNVSIVRGGGEEDRPGDCVANQLIGNVIILLWEGYAGEQLTLRQSLACSKIAEEKVISVYQIIVSFND